MLEQINRLPDYVGRLLDLPVRVDSLRKAGLLDPMRPDAALRSLVAVRQFGPLAGAAHIAALRDGHALALVDELGPLTFDQLDRRSNALSRAWTARGVRSDSVIAVLARDHRGLVDCMLAAAKLGARLLLMNTGFSKPQLTDVVAREEVAALAFDQEFGDLLGDVPADVPRYLSWLDDPDTVDPEIPKLDELIASSTDGPVPVPPKPGGLVLLTSGTTGTPKGAPRHVTGVLGATHFVERIPLRVGGATFIASPMFHATGLSQLILSLALGTTVVVRRRFGAEATLREIAENHCTGAVLVPTQLARILDLGEEVLARYDTSSLRTIITAGSLLPPDVSNRALRAFGPVLYNLYGSTEVAVASIATPEELRAAPGTVGRPPRGCVVRLYDKQGNRITDADAKGRIFVGSELAFGGYTGGGHKEIIDGLLSSGDVGHFDASGLLFVDGRDDDMIVSGGENVYPAEIENLLLERNDIADVVVMGVDDADFGQRLRAFVVAADGVTLSEDEIKAHVRANLARYKVPRDVIFLDELPRNPTGKVLRRKLAEYEP